MEVHDGNTGDCDNGRRLLHVVRNCPRQRRVPVSGVSTCAEHARGDELGEEGRGSLWGGQDTRCHKPTGAVQESALVRALIRLADGRPSLPGRLADGGRFSSSSLPGITAWDDSRGRYEGRGTQLLYSVDFITQQSKSGNNQK